MMFSSRLVFTTTGIFRNLPTGMTLNTVLNTFVLYFLSNHNIKIYNTIKKSIQEAERGGGLPGGVGRGRRWIFRATINSEN